MTARIQELERRKSDLVDLYIDRGIEQKDYEEHSDRLQSARKAAEAELHEVGFPLSELEQLIRFSEQMLTRLPDLWYRADPPENS